MYRSTDKQVCRWPCMYAHMFTLMFASLQSSYLISSHLICKLEMEPKICNPKSHTLILKPYNLNAKDPGLPRDY